MPDQTLRDERGGEIWIYQEEIVTVSPGTEEVLLKKKEGAKSQVIETRVVTPPSRTVRVHHKTFFVNPEGIICDMAFGTRTIQR